MKVKEAIEYVEGDGWYLVTVKGDHRQYKHRIKKGMVTIAGRPSVDLPTKTAHTIFKQAQIPWPQGKR